jgi:hypothetical protein
MTNFVNINALITLIMDECFKVEPHSPDAQCCTALALIGNG